MIRRFLVALLTTSLLALQAPAQAQTPVEDKQYTLRFGDALNVYVIENEDTEVDAEPIRPDGRISLPMIGDVAVAGLTIPQLHDRLAKAYSKYFVDPHVVVSVAHFRQLSISVVGLVNRPSTFAVPEKIRLLQAIGLAGGINDQRGDRSRVLVVRAKGQHQIIDVAQIEEGKAEDNILLDDGDTVRVFEVGGPDWYRLLPVIASSLSILTSLLVIGIDIKNNTK